MDLWGLVLFLLLTLAVSEVIPAGIDCLVAGDSCSGDEICSPRLRTLRQCVAGNGSMKLGPGARSQCANAVSGLLSSPLHGCQCKRGMKEEKNCLSIYWSLHQSIMHGLNLVESYPYETVHREYDYIRLASLAAESNVGVTTGNRCLDAAKACNVDDLCQKLRTEYVSACIKPTSKSGLCNRPKCNKALRRFFDRIPAHYTHKLLFCPCKDTACAERRRQTIVPSCSYESRDKPNCITQMKICNADYVCRSRLAQFQYDCEPSETAADGCKQGNYGACLLAYTGLIGSTITPNYVDNSTSRVAPWCSCSASGSRKDECDTFMGQFTDNTCLWNALITFESGSNQQPSISLLSTTSSSSTPSTTSSSSTPNASSTTSSSSTPSASSTTSSSSTPSASSTTSSSSTPSASSTTSSSSTPNASSTTSSSSTPSRISKSSGSSSGHSRRENRISTSPQETTKTMRNFLDTLMPTQALGNKLLMGQSSPPSDSLPNAASPFSLKLQAVVSLLLLLLHLLDNGL